MNLIDNYKYLIIILTDIFKYLSAKFILDKKKICR